MMQAAERVESLKAGCVGAAATAIEFVVTLIFHAILDFGLGISDFGSLAQQGFQSANCRLLCLNRYQVLIHRIATESTVTDSRETLFQLETLAQAAIVILSGGLFGITYRYVVRTDRNGQLQAGAVGAFGLVRGLAQIEASWAIAPYWLTGMRLFASLLMFAVAALLLNWSMQQGWIKRFEAS
jgi:hypothetical protein